MKAAAEGRARVAAETSLCLLAVTILTSYEHVRQAGYRRGVERMVIDRFIATWV